MKRTSARPVIFLVSALAAIALLIYGLLHVGPLADQAFIVGLVLGTWNAVMAFLFRKRVRLDASKQNALEGSNRNRKITINAAVLWAVVIVALVAVALIGLGLSIGSQLSSVAIVSGAVLIVVDISVVSRLNYRRE